MNKEPVRDEFIKKRIARQKKIKKRRLKIFFIFFIVLLLCTAAVLSFTVFFPIEKINVKGSKLYSADQIISVMGIGQGDNLFAISRSRTEQALKSELPYVDSISFERKLPGTLNVTVKDADEYACYLTENKYYIVSRSGWVMNEVSEPPENIMIVSASSVICELAKEIKIENSEEKDLIDKLLTSFQEKELKVNSIDVRDTVAISMRVNDRFEVQIGTPNFLEEKIDHLNSMIKKISEQKSGKINLSMFTNENKKATFVEEIKE